MQKYHSGEEVRIGDRVRLQDDEGTVVALREDLPTWGLSQDGSVGKAMIELKSMGRICQDTASSEDLVFVERAGK